MELDLIEISPKAEPPVCRIADYQKFLYQQKKKAKELKANQVKVVIKEIRFGPQTDDHDYNFKLKHATNFLKEGCQGQGVRLLPRPFDRLQGAGRNPAAPLRHRPRRGRQSGDDAQARRQEDEHDAGAQNQQEVAAERFRHRAKRLYPIHNRGPGRESDCGFLFHDRRKRQRDGGLSHTCGSGPAGMHLRERALGTNCGNELPGTTRGGASGRDFGDGLSGTGFRGRAFGNDAGTSFRRRASGRGFRGGAFGEGLSGRGFREQTFGSATQGTALPDLFRPQKRDFAEFRNIFTFAMK